MNEALRPKTDDEEKRLTALRRYKILDTEPEEEFDEIVTLVRSIFNISYAAINLIDFDRQWTKATAPEQAGLRTSCSRSEAFCNYTIRGSGALVVNDAMRDPRFAGNHFVIGPPGVRSYLGVPLTTSDGHNIGALCVYGTEPRTFSDADKEILGNFAKVVMSQFELRLTARTDGLTGVLTQRAFLTRLDRVIAENTEQPNCLALLDLDYFKSINDQFGHAAGDAVLVRVAGLMSDLSRRADSVGRLGGEEFGILLHGIPLSEGQAFIDGLQTQLSKTSIPKIGKGTVTISAGIAERRKGETRESWFERADGALYAAKRSGRNRVVKAALAGTS